MPRYSARRLPIAFLALALLSACSTSTPTAPSTPAGTSQQPGALTITAQPLSQAVQPGNAVTLSVAAAGSGSLAYQWFEGASGTTNAPVADAKSPTYATPALTRTTSFWVRLTDARGSADSTTATITVEGSAAPAPVGTAPAITTEPESRTVAPGQAATLVVGAGGSAPLAYQWFVGSTGPTSTPVAGATAASFTTPALTATTSYWVRVSNAVGDADSVTATVTVSTPSGPTSTAPVITASPQSQTVAAGQTATMSVAATGTAPMSYQWYSGATGITSTPLAGATSASLVTPPLSATNSYWVRVSNSVGAADSGTATITVQPAAPAPAPAPGPSPDPTPPPAPPTGVAPAIASQPQSQTVASGQTATLSVTATGTGPFGYQWYAGVSGSTTTPVTGATGSTHTTPPLSATSSYWVRVSNAYGGADSATATVTVSAPAPPPPPPSSSNPAFEDEVLTLVNQRRAAGATCGGTPYPAVGPLYMDPNLHLSARGHSEDMAINGYFSHTSLDGRTFDQRIRNAGYAGAFPLGENIAGGYTSPASVVNGWMASTGHCTNIMNANFRAIGVGHIYRLGSPFIHYWTQNFGGS